MPACDHYQPGDGRGRAVLLFASSSENTGLLSCKGDTSQIRRAKLLCSTSTKASHFAQNVLLRQIESSTCPRSHIEYDTIVRVRIAEVAAAKRHVPATRVVYYERAVRTVQTFGTIAFGNLLQMAELSFSKS